MRAGVKTLRAVMSPVRRNCCAAYVRCGGILSAPIKQLAGSGLALRSQCVRRWRERRRSYTFLDCDHPCKLFSGVSGACTTDRDGELFRFLNARCDRSSGLELFEYSGSHFPNSHRPSHTSRPGDHHNHGKFKWGLRANDFHRKQCVSRIDLDYAHQCL